MGQEGDVRFEIVVPEREADALERDVQAAGGAVVATKPFEPNAEEADLHGDRQFEPLTIVAVAAGAVFIIDRISDIWLDHTRPGGQIVDLRTVPAQVRPAPYLDRGELLVIRAEGRESFYARNRKEAASILRAIVGARDA